MYIINVEQRRAAFRKLLECLWVWFFIVNHKLFALTWRLRKKNLRIKIPVLIICGLGLLQKNWLRTNPQDTGLAKCNSPINVKMK